MPTSFRWTLTDPSTSESYTFEMNPSDGGSPPVKKHLTYQATAAPNGSLVLFEGRDEPPLIEFTGTLVSQDQYNAFLHWYAKRHQVVLVDDLGRSSTIYITEFTPKRKRTMNYPWRHDYTIRAYLLSTVGP